MKHAVTALLSAASLCAFAWAAPAAAQTMRAPLHPPAPIGECQMIAGNHVCFAGPSYAYGYYGPGYAPPGGPIGAAVAAPVAAAGAVVGGTAAAAGQIAAAPFWAPPAAPVYAYNGPPTCSMIAGNRVCT
jgi:hypothetical protein